MSSFLSNNALDLPELATRPAAPDAGRRKLYLGDGGVWYSVGSDGEAVAVGGASGNRKVLLANLTSGNPPTFEIHVNTLGANVTASRPDPGAFNLNFSVPFQHIGHIYVTAQVQGDNATEGIQAIVYLGEETIQILFWNGTEATELGENAMIFVEAF